MTLTIPSDPAELDEGVVQTLIRSKYPDAAVRRVRVLDAALSTDGEQNVSTARRIGVEVEYSGDVSLDLPRRLLVKVGRPELGDLPLYTNEVNVYTRLGDSLPVNTPGCFGAIYDAASGTFGLVLEDLRVDGATFNSATSPTTAADIEKLLDQLARLHAKYWCTPRFDDDLDWVHPHTSGPIHDLFFDPHGVPALIAHEVRTQQFKRELVEAVEESTDSLFANVSAVQQHQATLTQTIVHGDTHIGNTYVDGTGGWGLLDWQLTARGYCMHDVTYIVLTGLTVADRRAHERRLIAYYRDRLAAAGVADVPPLDQLLDEHRIAAAWCFYIGWLTTPVDNYGWEITVANHIRLATAYRDLDTKQAIADLRRSCT